MMQKTSLISKWALQLSAKTFTSYSLQILALYSAGHSNMSTFFQRFIFIRKAQKSIFVKLGLEKIVPVQIKCPSHESITR